MIIQTMRESQFIDAFMQHEERKRNFSYHGLKALYEYLDQLSEDCDMQIEFDMIAICCEFTEYDDLEELQENYTDIESFDDLEDHTSVIRIPDQEGFIIQDY